MGALYDDILVYGQDFCLEDLARAGRQ